MKNISITDILKLPVQERVRLIGLIWDSIAAVPEAVEISPFGERYVLRRVMR